MSDVNSRLTVFFEEPYWIGVFEHIEDGKLTVAKVVFGAEPKDYEVYEFVLKHYHSLRFSPALAAVVKKSNKNPKRVHREVRKQLQNACIGTKSQQALKLQQEQNKRERKVKSRKQKKDEMLRLFELKQQKKKLKHRGR